MLARLLRVLLSVTCVCLATSEGAWPLAEAAGDNGQCMADVVQQLELRCNNSSPSYKAILSQYRAQCCSRPLQVLAPSTLRSWIEKQATQFEEQVSTAVNVTYEDPNVIPSRIDEQLAGWAQHDLWVIDGASLPSLVYRQALLALEQKVQDNPDVDWPGFQELWANLTVTGGRTIAVPLSSDALLMYYRRDTLAALGRAIPTSWANLLDLATSWNASSAAAGTEASSPPSPKHALCISTAPSCSSTAYLLSAILASITQRWGPRTGWALALDEADPWVALQLLNGSAMVHGLATFYKLAAASPAGLTCEEPLELFAQGQCLVTLGLGREFATLQRHDQDQTQNSAGASNGGNNASLVRGVVGVALPPGSTLVLDRASGTLVPAGPEACRVPVRSSSSSAAGGGGAALWACAAPMLSYGGTFGVVGRRNGAVYQDLAFQFATWLSSLEAQWQGLSNQGAGGAPAAVQPVRESMLAAEAADQLAAEGYDVIDARSYLEALRAAFTSPNVALEFGAPGAFALRLQMEDAIQAYLGGTKAETAADAMLRGWVREWERLNFTVQQVQQLVLAATPDPFGDEARTQDGRGRQAVVGWVVAVGVTGALALLALIVLALWCYRACRGEARLRRIIPPGISPQTTLVVTDIQDSTKLWELLHSDVMDVAIYHHHSLARRLVLRFRGYESATEGDSFIIAFHTADDAVCFCALFQQDLLLVPWPAELLALDGCKAVWMCKSEPEPKRRRDSQQSQQPLEVTRSGAPLSVLALQGIPPGLRLASTTRLDTPAASLQRLQLPIPALAPLLTIGSQNDQQPDNTSVTLSMVPRSGPQHSLSLGLIGIGTGDGVAAGAASSLSGSRHATAASSTAGYPELTPEVAGNNSSTHGTSGPTGAAAAEALNGLPLGSGGTASFPALGPVVPPRFARSTAPYVLTGSASSGMHTMGALGASPRQLSFLGRSLSRLGASSIPSSTTAGAGCKPVSPSASFAAAVAGAVASGSGGRVLERHSTPRSSSGSGYRTAGAAAVAGERASHSGGDDILTNSPTSPVAFTYDPGREGGSGGGGSEPASMSLTAAAARAGFASGAVMSFRESFREDGRRGGAGSGGDSDEGAGGRGSACPSSPPPVDLRQSDDAGCRGPSTSGAELKPPTLTGYPAVSAAATSRSSSLAGGDGCSAGGGVRGGDLKAAGSLAQPHSAVRRSLSASGRSGGSGGVGASRGASEGGGDGNGISRSGGGSSGMRVLRGRGRLSATGSRSAARRSSTDTFDVAPERTTNNSRQSRSTEIATVSEFNVVLESGGQHFIQPRSETDVGPHQLSPTWGAPKLRTSMGAGHLPAVVVQAMPAQQPIAAVTSAAGGAGAGGGITVGRVGSGAAAAAGIGPLGEGAATLERALGMPYSPRAAVRRSSVTFDIQCSGAGGASGGGTGCDDGASGSGGGGSAGTTTSGTAAQPTAHASGSQRSGAGSQSLSSPQLETSGAASRAEPTPQEYPPPASLGAPNISHAGCHPSSRQSSLACRRAPSHLGPLGGSMLMSTPPLPFTSRAASLRRRSDLTPSATAAAAGYSDYTYTSSYAAAVGLYGHGTHGYDGALRPSPLGRGVSQSSISGFPLLRPATRGSQGGGTSDATGQRSSNSRSLRGPSVDGEDTGDQAELSAAYVGQSSPLPTLFPAGTLSDDDTGSGPGGTAAGGPSATAATGAAAGGTPASPPFSSYTGGAATGGIGAAGRSSNVKRSMTDGTTLQQQLQRHRTSALGTRVASSPLTISHNTAAVSVLQRNGGAEAPALSQGPATSATLPSLNFTVNSLAQHHAQHHAHGHGHGHALSRSLLALVSLPSPRIGGGTAAARLSSLGIGGHMATSPHAPESRAGSMASMMRLASQHNLQSVGDSLCSRWRVVEEGEQGAQLVFRGLRVRMGVHSGLSEATDLAQLNRTANRMQYTGVGLSMAKAVADCAHGGQILMSEAAFTQLAVESLREGVMVLHMGEHRIKDDLPNISLYCGCPRGLQGRLPALRAVRSRQQFSLGVLDAPAGGVVVVFMHVVGAVSLLEWRPDLATTALAMFRDHVSLELIKYQGYLVEAVDGLVLASFSSPSAGLVWVAKCQSDMTMLPWPEELMCHEACEELCVTRLNPNTGVHEDVVVFRGLRLKAGVDMGRLRGEINCVTGRMSYRGRAMNRAARIVAAAGSGQILASSEVWLAAASESAARVCGLTGASMGQFVLKGVAEPIEVYQIKTAAGVISRRARTVLSRPEGPLELDELPITDPVAALQHHVNINNAGSSAAAAAAAASAAALARQASAASSPALRAGSVTAAGGFGASAGAAVAGSGAAGGAAAAAAAGGGTTSRLMLGRMHSVSGGLAAALKREESMTRRPLSRNVSMRSSRRSSVGSQFSNLAANTMVAAARGSFDGRQDATSPLRAATTTTTTAAAGTLGGSLSGPAQVAGTPSLPAAIAAAGASVPSASGGAGSAGQVVISVGPGPSQRSASQPQLMAPISGLSPIGSVNAGTIHTGASGLGLATSSVNAVGALQGTSVLGNYHTVAGYAPLIAAPGPAVAAGNGGSSGVGVGSGTVPYHLPSLGSGTRTSRTSRNSAAEQADTTDGGHSSNPRSSNASNRSGHPLWGPRLTAGLQFQSSHQHPQQAGSGNAAYTAAANSPVQSRSGPAQGIVRHISAFIRSASLAFQGGSSGHNSAAAAATAAAVTAAATATAAVGAGAQSSSYHPMLLASPPAGRRGGGSGVTVQGGPEGPTGGGTVLDIGLGLISSVDRGGATNYHRSGETGLRDSASGVMDTRLLSTGGLVAPLPPGGATAGGGSGGARAGSGGGSIRERIPARIRAAGGLFRAGSFSGYMRRRAVDDSSRASDLGLTAAGAGRTTRSPLEGGRRFVSTATGLGYVASATAIGGTTGGLLQPGSPAMSPAPRGAGAGGAGAGGVGSSTAGGYFCRRDVHGAGAAGAGISSIRRRESRGDALLLDRYLPEGENGFVIVVGEEDIEGESDSDGLDAGSGSGEAEEAPEAASVSPPAVTAALQAASASEAGGRGVGSAIIMGGIGGSVSGTASGGERQHQRPSGPGPGLSITATLMRLNSGRVGGGAGGGGASGSVVNPGSGASLHL